MFLKNTWYVAAWSHEITADGLFQRSVCSQSLLFYRTADGTVVALDNRCCHRHAPLSLGRKEGDCVRCMYHGLKFDAHGVCVEIPGQNAIPTAARVRAYPVVERRQWVWVWMGDPARADAALIPDTVALDHPDWRYKPAYLHYQASHELISDNVLDFSHLSYVHEKTLGGATAIAATRPKIELLDNGVRITREVRDAPLAPYFRQFVRMPAIVDRTWIYEYLVPGVLLLETRATARQAAAGEADFMSLLSCQAITPETAGSAHYFFMQAHSFARDDANVTETIYQSVMAAFAEDKRIVEAQHALISTTPPAEMLGLPFDLGVVQFRRLMERRRAAD